MYLKNYDSLSECMRYFIDQTGLKPGVGIIGLHPIIMKENNTLGLPAGDNYLNRKNLMEKLDLSKKQIIILSFKLFLFNKILYVSSLLMGIIF